ncbi:phosphatase PAP2 family protein [Yimella sp. cx-51]|uniref:phosphatase PAP2 family protein n=1 Tax=Yimella sp. cx-51 TaxID=2770551 RepID=UPI00165EABDD|nr:phosphatase PAP2 family protein [Yimella sp. cx-51]MBC9958237.1 phosphatase PAP2 family protein [Yimella sp. cx-51]QTH38734.1 phosphatase PAP2 family protein [Yimella sp. cx-51]
MSEMTTIRQPAAGHGAPRSGSAAGRDRRVLLVNVAAMVLTALATGYALVKVFLHTYRGAEWDHRLMKVLGGPPEAFDRIVRFISTVSVTSVLDTLAVSVLVALLQRRVAVAASVVVLVFGATLTTQVLKYDVLHRVVGANALPSGHSTAALLWALGAVLVAPRAWRPAVTVAGTLVAATIGVGTIAGRWHRPADVVAAAAVCLGWSALAILMSALLGRRHIEHAAGSPPRWRYAALAAVATVLSTGVFFLLGFELGGTGIERIGAGIVLVTIVALLAATIAWVAWLADREID